MARKPNYNFDRRERERLKADKKAKRVAAKEEARKAKSESAEDTLQESDEKPDLPTTE